MNSTAFVVIGIAVLAGGVGMFGTWLIRHRTRPTGLLTGVTLLSAGVLALVTGWVLAGGGISRGEALKTGGLAGGAVVALYALWLNDRRRRTEEERREIERSLYQVQVDRTEIDRARALDERFARAVELLGNEADQVRVGAMHALAGLGGHPAFTQTVLDVLCAYLRRPFDHYRFAEIREEKERTWPEPDRREAERELQVRTTAQRLIADLLPLASDPDAPAYDLDLHGATLEYFDVSGRVIGQLRARQTNLYESNAFKGTEFRREVWFTGARCWGRLYAPGVVFEDRAWFKRVAWCGVVDFKGAAFRGLTSFAEGDFDGSVSFDGATFTHPIDLVETRFRRDLDLRVGAATARTHAMKVSLKHEVRLPAGWVLDKTHGPEFGLVRA